MVTDLLKVVRVEPSFLHHRFLLLQTFDLETAPFGLTSFAELLLHRPLLFHFFDVDLLYLELDPAQLDNVVLFENIWLFHVAIGNVSDD